MTEEKTKNIKEFFLRETVEIFVGLENYESARRLSRKLGITQAYIFSVIYKLKRMSLIKIEKTKRELKIEYTPTGLEILGLFKEIKSLFRKIENTYGG